MYFCSCSLFFCLFVFFSCQLKKREKWLKEPWFSITAVIFKKTLQSAYPVYRETVCQFKIRTLLSLSSRRKQDLINVLKLYELFSYIGTYLRISETELVVFILMSCYFCNNFYYWSLLSKNRTTCVNLCIISSDDGR